MPGKSRAPTTLPAAAQVAMVPRPQLRLWSIRPALSAPHPIGERLTLGRDPGSSPALCVADPTVSREHVEISWSGAAQGYVALDLGSKNGTTLDGEALGRQPRLLGDGAVLRAGDALWVVERSDSAPTGEDTPAIPGRSAAISRLRVEVERAAPEPAPVLLLGETGTGKELIAQEIHRRSGREGPLVSVNCAELGREIAESQLFGHGRGAFTGASEPSPGLFRSADGGTLFLDEVGELPEALQPKLLRALQGGEVRPVGHTRSVQVDVRVIAATNRDLPSHVERGEFRRDLYARLALWEIRVPPLRERRADLPIWVALFRDAWRERHPALQPTLDLGADAWELLLLHAWPDNLRGVDRVVQRLSAEGATGPVTRSRIEALLTPPSAGKQAGPTRERPPPPSREELEAALAAHGSVRAVAKVFGRDRRQIYRWMRAFGLER